MRGIIIINGVSIRGCALTMPGVSPTTVGEKRPFAEAFAEAISDGAPAPKTN